MGGSMVLMEPTMVWWGDRGVMVRGWVWGCHEEGVGMEGVMVSGWGWGCHGEWVGMGVSW